jgi:hypothetical protein
MVGEGASLSALKVKSTYMQLSDVFRESKFDSWAGLRMTYILQ